MNICKECESEYENECERCIECYKLNIAIIEEMQENARRNDKIIKMLTSPGRNSNDV